MITMSTDAEPLNIVALGKKIGKVNAVAAAAHAVGDL